METSVTQSNADATHCDGETSEQVSPATCEAMLVGVDPRRFVVVRKGSPQRLWPIDGGWEELCRLKPGDEVMYQGIRTVIRAIGVYR